MPTSTTFFLSSPLALSRRIMDFSTCLAVTHPLEHRETNPRPAGLTGALSPMRAAARSRALGTQSLFSWRGGAQGCGSAGVAPAHTHCSPARPRPLILSDHAVVSRAGQHLLPTEARQRGLSHHSRGRPPPERSGAAAETFPFTLVWFSPTRNVRIQGKN